MFSHFLVGLLCTDAEALAVERSGDARDGGGGGDHPSVYSPVDTSKPGSKTLLSSTVFEGAAPNPAFTRHSFVYSGTLH